MDWISVRKALPLENRLVLCWDTQRFYIAFRRLEAEYNEHWVICEDCECLGVTGPVTHWQELPEPPDA